VVSNGQVRRQLLQCMNPKVFYSFVLMIIASCGRCAAATNLLFVHKGGIMAQGSVSKGREQIDLIQISTVTLSDSQLRDFWVDLSPSNRVTFTELGENAIKQICSTNFALESSGTVSNMYYVGGYSFAFSGGRLITLQASRYGFPPKEAATFTKVGSKHNQSSISLPCSLDDFEKVFGKADKIERGFGW